MTSTQSHSHFDVIIIGAGINGAGIARDASMRGLQVLLLDKGDLGSGTSSWSTRLIHGGLRYLEQCELGLVRESLRERENLLKIAPHLVRPLPILIPIYENSSRGRAVIWAGMIVYDLLAFDKTLPAHRMLSRQKTLAAIPGLNPVGLLGGAIYYDCQVQFAERLVLENVLSAKEHGAAVLTYAQVTRVEKGKVEFFRRLDNQREIATANIVVNAAGPWVDQILSKSTPKTERLIGGTKGSHIIVAPFSGAPSMAVYIEAKSDRRPFFVIPWNNNYLIGTTDIRFEGDPDEARADRWEVEYLLKETNCVFPNARLSFDNISYVYSGVRPLPYSENMKAQRITRRHFIREHHEDQKLFSVVGGKLTTYRSLAEECVDLIFKKLGKRSPRCTTNNCPLPGANDFVDIDDNLRWLQRFPEIDTERLLGVYGSRLNQVLQLSLDRQATPLYFNKRRDALSAEIIFSFESEFAQTLADCLLRRTMIGLNSDLAIGDEEAAAEIGKRFLGWTDQRALDEISEYRRTVQAMKLAGSWSSRPSS